MAIFKKITKKLNTSKSVIKVNEHRILCGCTSDRWIDHVVQNTTIDKIKEFCGGHDIKENILHKCDENEKKSELSEEKRDDITLHKLFLELMDYKNYLIFEYALKSSDLKGNCFDLEIKCLNVIAYTRYYSERTQDQYYDELKTIRKTLITRLTSFIDLKYCHTYRNISDTDFEQMVSEKSFIYGSY